MTDYESYIAHQAHKLTLHRDQIAKHDRAYEKVLAIRLREHSVLWAGKSVLCLGARLGAEVRAFRSLGCFAVGVDVNPGKDNLYVLWGDFHALTFPAECVDVVFTNSLDHVLNFDLVLSQVRRVLTSSGLLVAEIVRGTDEGYRPDKYDIYHWKRAEDVITAIVGAEFVEVRRRTIKNPWPGIHVLWEKQD